MALFSTSYTPPGVYTETILNDTVASLPPSARIPVLIGEGQQVFTESNVEMHRGSSATSDDQVVAENLTAQVNGTTGPFQLSHFPVVTGNGTGTVTNNPSYLSVTVVAPGQTAALPVTVLSLNGATGQFSTQTIVPEGSSLYVNYYFKRTDTQVLNENDSFQVPTFATLAIQATLHLSLTIPGALGNDVTLALTLATTGSGVSDLQAVSGAGTNAISIELRNTDNTVRTLAEVAALINAGIETTAGYITVVSGGSSSTAGAALTATAFTGGAGPNTNTIFKVQQTPIVDGTNGGVVTTDPTKVSVTVNGQPATVTAVDGSTGLVTLANAVPAGATLLATYFTNTWQNTSDQLPSSNVASIVEIGFGPNTSNFVEGVDYTLNGNSIAWGAAVSTAAGQNTAGFPAFNATDINTTLVDQKVYLRLLSGATSGVNSVFTLPDVPVDGSGLGVPTDDPSLVKVYVGPNPIEAASSGAVTVAQLSGASAKVTLYNPAAQGQNVYATYYRSVLNDHAFTVAVKTAGTSGQGTYTVTDENNQIVPVASNGTDTVANANFADTGIVWPSNFSDLQAAIGGAAETVTLTFQDDGLSTITTPAVQASIEIASTLVFTATTPGTAGNSVTIALLSGGTGQADATAISVSGTAVTVELLMADQETVRTWAEVIALFSSFPPTVSGAGVILCSAAEGASTSGQATAQAATNLAGGAAAVSTPFANRFLVTTSRTAQQAQADGLGLTGGATTPEGGNADSGSGAVGASGYLGQTYIDQTTGVQFTIVDPASALSYGYTQLPSPSYKFTPGDTLSFVISRTAGFVTGETIVAVPGLKTDVVSTLGNKVGDTALISTFSRSGNSPAVGEYYYVTFTVNKQASDFALQTFASPDDAYAEYGQPNSVNNRLSIAIQLLTANGAGQFGVIQVPVVAGTAFASDQSFIDAINSLTTPIPGGGKAGVIVPLSTSVNVQQALSQFLTKQATPRQKGEAIAFVGFNQYSTPTAASATAQAIANQRVIAVWPPALGIMLQPSVSQPAVENLVSGEFLAAATAGLNLNPSNDVATTLTGQKVIGFSRALQEYNSPTKDQLAQAGITVFDSVPGALECRHYKTTNPANPLTSEPYVTTINDFVAKAFRKNFKQFVGRKELSTLPSSMEAVGNSLMNGWVNNLISAAGPVSVVQDSSDPTTFDVTVSYAPMWSVLWINVTFSVNISMNN
jgi:hypothetical protein